VSSDELNPQPTFASEADLVEFLTEAELDIVGRMPTSSNATFLVRAVRGDTAGYAIYKPLKGERPLWDFEPGLHRREVAAYRLSAAMGLGVVPVTVLRPGPAGEGSLQWFIEARFEEHYFTLYAEHPHLHHQLQAIAVFDFVANNTDRKGGHCLLDHQDRVWAIDHGLCFAVDFKLRTVIWDFGGEPIPDTLQDAVRPLADQVPLEVATLLSDDEVEAVSQRATWLLERGVFPVDRSGRLYPWPLI
jgi:uncharacterized repeat protein (TIGR03843 family)